MAQENCVAPLVSVVVPTHNRASLVERALRSVLAQTYQALEIIVVDDASSDDTAKRVNTFRDDRIVYIRLAENGGACHARNVGIRNANGRYIAFLDSDDEYVPTKIERQVAVMQSSTDPDLGAVTCGCYEVRPGAKDMVWIPTHTGNVLRPLLEHRRIGIGPQHLLCDARVFNEGVRFDERLPARQDFDFAVQLCQRFTLAAVPEVLVRIYHHDGERVYTPRRSVEASLILREKYARLLEEEPRLDAIFSLRMVRMYAAVGDSEHAMEEARRAYALDPSFISFLWYLFAGSLQQGKLSLANRVVLKGLIRLTHGQRRWPAGAA